MSIFLLQPQLTVCEIFSLKTDGQEYSLSKQAAMASLDVYPNPNWIQGFF